MLGLSLGIGLRLEMRLRLGGGAEALGEGVAGGGAEAGGDMLRLVCWSVVTRWISTMLTDTAFCHSSLRRYWI